MSMSYLPPAAMRRSPSAPRSFVTLAKVSRDSVSNSVSSALGLVNMRLWDIMQRSLRSRDKFHLAPDGFHRGDPARIDYLHFGLPCEEGRHPQVAERGNFRAPMTGSREYDCCAARQRSLPKPADSMSSPACVAIASPSHVP